MHLFVYLFVCLFIYSCTSSLNFKKVFVFLCFSRGGSRSSVTVVFLMSVTFSSSVYFWESHFGLLWIIRSNRYKLRVGLWRFMELFLWAALSPGIHPICSTCLVSSFAKLSLDNLKKPLCSAQTLLLVLFLRKHL